MAYEQLEPDTREFYVRAMRTLDDAGIEYLVGGAYALAHHANVVRHTKDFDVFVHKRDAQRTLDTFAAARLETELTFPHWLGKAFRRNSEDFIDVIFGSGNGLCPVDDDWFKCSVQAEVFGRPARLCPAEEIIWTKSFVQERERFDGADVAHILWKQGVSLDWNRLERRFKGHEQVLLAHLILFTYVYPYDKDRVPASEIERLFKIARAEPSWTEKVCRGTFLSRAQYLMDLRERGYEDARVQPRGPMKAEDVAHWTAAIGRIQ
jgi:hypothetical protein